MSHRKARFIVTAMLALVTGTAAASDWQPVYSDDAASLTMDVASLVREGPVVRAWVRTVYAKAVLDGAGAEAWAALAREYYDCKSRRAATKQINFYSDTKFQKVLHVGPTANDLLLDWKEVPPDTVGEGLLEFACSNAPK
jgi:hypothetical protein